MGQLEGKVAIITGATGGIGSATARHFVREGARVFLVDRDRDALAALCKEFEHRADYAVGDVSSEEDTRSYVAQAVERFGWIDILFANAGIEGKFAPLVELDAESFDRVMQVNVRGAFLGIKHAAPEIAKQGGGSIIITASIAALVGSRGLGAYVASKHALTGLCRTAALELAHAGIRVNTLNPGPIDNRMMRSIEDQASPGSASNARDAFTQQVALERYGTNGEIAKLALFLAGPSSSYCTGGQFVADGGFTAQ